MSAADLLRVALDDAPQIEVTRDDTGLTTVHVMRDDWGTPAWFASTVEEDKAVRLVELLLAVAPHLVELLTLPPHGPSAPRMADLLGEIDAAITEKAALL